jgi:hypothetical protein
MRASIKNLIWASCLTLAAMPFLYVGGQNGSSTLIYLGFVIFCVGMAIAPIQFLTKKAQATKSSSVKGRVAS